MQAERGPIGACADALRSGRHDAACDVLVVGAGLAGYCAALEAAYAGADVLLVEKQRAPGGTTLLSGGAIAFAGTDEQARSGIQDSDECLLEDLRQAGGGRSNERLMKTYADRQRETYEWLKAQDVAFRSVQLGSGQSVPRSIRTDPRQMMEALARAAQHSGRIEMRTGCSARRLVRSGTDGAVCGVVAQQNESHIAILARCGVVLTSGGFARNPGLIAKFAPEMSTARAICAEGSTGDGLLMGWSAGADLADMSCINATFGVHPRAVPGQNALLLHPIYKGAVAVTAHGKRFMDESCSYKTLGAACLRQPGSIAYQIFDRPIMDASVDGVETSDFAAALRAGLVHQAMTLRELALRSGIDADALETTLSRYNGDVRKGGDTVFGRKTLAHRIGRPPAIDTAPFYAFPCTSAILATYCGLAVDEHGCVLDVYGEPIAALYAAGEITGGFHGNGYMTGSSLGKAAVFGRLAGRAAAARLAKVQ